MAVNTHCRGRFAKDVLAGLGVPYRVTIGHAASIRRMTALLAWMRAESGNGGNTGNPNDGPENNPHCSTWPYTYPTYNKVGVRDYPDFDTGVNQTLNTLNLSGHNYEPIVAAILRGDTLAIVQAVDNSDWGTHGAEDALPYTTAHYRQEFNRTVGVSSLT